MTWKLTRVTDSVKCHEQPILAALILFALALGGCENAIGTGYSNPQKVAEIERRYEARDTCLARNAAAQIGGNPDAESLATAVALACQAETNRLIQASNVSEDPLVATKIQQDSAFRARGYVLRARREMISQ